MFDSTVIEVVTGIVFLYLLFSLLCSVINEWIAAIFNIRAETLKKGIKNLLNDPDFTTLAQKVYSHGLVDGLSEEGKLPSYIPSRAFAVSLLDVLTHPGRGLEPPATPAAGVPRPPLPPAAAPDSIDANWDSLMTAVNALPKGRSKQALLTLIAESGRDVAALETAIEAWFNDAMERVSGWYKRWSQIVLVVLSFFVVGAANADTIVLAKRLASDNALRAALVAAADRTVRDHPTVPEGKTAQQLVRETLVDSRALNLPLGWVAQDGDPFKEEHVPTTSTGMAMKVLGLLLSGALVSLGAPFWFDVLQKVTRIRSTGKRPDENRKAP